jgi:predicted nucleic acid-binding Zn ribbon protein
VERIGEEVDRELRRSGSRDVLPLTRLVAIWPDVMGAAIAAQAWPLRVSRDGTLHVATSSATWANELTLLGDEILGRLRAELGPETPSSLRCAVGPVPEPAAATPSSMPDTPRADTSPEVSATASAVASAIEDRELRDLVARAARASLARAASDRHF